MQIGCPSAEFITASIGISQPEARDKIRRLRFIRVEITVQSQQYKDIFLRIFLAALLAMCQQSVDHFGNQITLRVIFHQGIQ